MLLENANDRVAANHEYKNKVVDIYIYLFTYIYVYIGGIYGVDIKQDVGI